jgi:hypothetical protein
MKPLSRQSAGPSRVAQMPQVLLPGPYRRRRKNELPSILATISPSALSLVQSEHPEDENQFKFYKKTKIMSFNIEITRVLQSKPFQ